MDDTGNWPCGPFEDVRPARHDAFAVLPRGISARTGTTGKNDRRNDKVGRAHRAWIGSEDATLRHLSGQGVGLEIMTDQLQRSPGSIRKRLEHLGLPTPKVRWTTQKIKQLKTVLKKAGSLSEASPETALMVFEKASDLTGMSVTACKEMSRRIGFRIRDKREPLNAEEIQTIIIGYINRVPPATIARKLNRPVGTIYTFASREKIVNLARRKTQEIIEAGYHEKSSVEQISAQIDLFTTTIRQNIVALGSVDDTVAQERRPATATRVRQTIHNLDLGRKHLNSPVTQIRELLSCGETLDEAPDKLDLHPSTVHRIYSTYSSVQREKERADYLKHASREKIPLEKVAETLEISPEWACHLARRMGLTLPTARTLKARETEEQHLNLLRAAVQNNTLLSALAKQMNLTSQEAKRIAYRYGLFVNKKGEVKTGEADEYHVGMLREAGRAGTSLEDAAKRAGLSIQEARRLMLRYGLSIPTEAEIRAREKELAQIMALREASRNNNVSLESVAKQIGMPLNNAKALALRHGFTVPSAKKLELRNREQQRIRKLHEAVAANMSLETLAVQIGVSKDTAKRLAQRYGINLPTHLELAKQQREENRLSIVLLYMEGTMDTDTASTALQCGAGELEKLAAQARTQISQIRELARFGSNQKEIAEQTGMAAAYVAKLAKASGIRLGRKYADHDALVQDFRKLLHKRLSVEAMAEALRETPQTVALIAEEIGVPVSLLEGRRLGLTPVGEIQRWLQQRGYIVVQIAKGWKVDRTELDSDEALRDFADQRRERLGLLPFP